eukprot:4469522-Pleurochrysis_carterae.AAC.5
MPAEIIARYPHLTTVQALAAATADGFTPGPESRGPTLRESRLYPFTGRTVRRALHDALCSALPPPPPSAPPSPPATVPPPTSSPPRGCGASSFTTFSVAFNAMHVVAFALYAARLSYDSVAIAEGLRMRSGDSQSTRTTCASMMPPRMPSFLASCVASLSFVALPWASSSFPAAQRLADRVR